MDPPPQRRRRRHVDPDTGGVDLDPRQAGAKIFELLLDMYSQCAPVSAKDVCVMCYYLNLANTEGAYFRDFGMAPGHQSGKYKSHLSKMLPKACPTTRVLVPSYVRGRAHHHTRDVPFTLTYASVVKEVRLNQRVLDLLASGDPDNLNSPLNLPCYSENILTQSCEQETGRLPLPLAVYVDGVRFTALQAGRSDSILVATCVNLLTEKRH
eukprot:9471855-Pyramimonas_sp.AAC.1